jgi:hypothetical protein
LLSYTAYWGWFFHVTFWVFFGAGTVALTIALGSFFAFLSLHLVRQKFIYAVIVSFILLIFILFLLFGAWSSYIEFSWEIHPYRTFNRILFSLFTLNLFSIGANIQALAKSQEEN